MKTKLQNESEDNWPLGFCTPPEHTRNNQPQFLHAWLKQPQEPNTGWGITGTLSELQVSPGIPQHHMGPAAVRLLGHSLTQDPVPFHLYLQDIWRKIRNIGYFPLPLLYSVFYLFNEKQNFWSSSVWPATGLLKNFFWVHQHDRPSQLFQQNYLY